MPANKFSQSGFTLIEMVIGITTFAIALTIVSGVIAPQITKSVEPIYQVRATELAQSMFNEILGKQYDENSDPLGGRIRCDEDLNSDGQIDASATGGEGERACSTTLGPDANETRGSFDDIDDYNGYVDSNVVKNSLGQDLTLDGENLYEGFSVAVAVIYDSDMDGIANNLEEPVQSTTGNIKLVRISVTTPNGDALDFTSFKHNY